MAFDMQTLSAQLQHEVRTPLSVIQFNAEQLADEIDDPRVQKHFDLVKEQVKKCNDWVTETSQKLK